MLQIGRSYGAFYATNRSLLRSFLRYKQVAPTELFTLDILLYIERSAGAFRLIIFYKTGSMD